MTALFLPLLSAFLNLKNAMIGLSKSASECQTHLTKVGKKYGKMQHYFRAN
jgi:hypothetical protein